MMDAVPALGRLEWSASDPKQKVRALAGTLTVGPTRQCFGSAACLPAGDRWCTFTPGVVTGRKKRVVVFLFLLAHITHLLRLRVARGEEIPAPPPPSPAAAIATAAARSKPIQKYCQTVYDISSIVNPLVEDLCKSPEDQLNEVLRELDTAIHEASGLIANWHQTTSKIYFKIQDVNYEHLFDLVKEVAMEFSRTSAASPENLLKLSSSLGLSTNMELYMEAVSLENLRTRALRSENREELDLAEQMIPLVNYMHEDLLRETQLLSINGVPIPADFCCPLSLELMSDPVIVASGQTYEKVYIKDLSAAGSSPLHSSVVCRANVPGSPEADLYLRNLNGASPPHAVAPHQNFHVHAMPIVLLMKSRQVNLQRMQKLLHQIFQGYLLQIPKQKETNVEGRRAGSIGQTSEQSTEEAFQSSNPGRDMQDHVASSSVNGSLPNSGQLDGECDNGVTRVPSDRTNYSSDASGEVTDGGAPVASSAPQREHLIPSRLVDPRTRGQFVRRLSSDKGFPRIISSSSVDTRSDLSAIESQVRKLIDDLKSDSIDVKRAAASEIRLLAKHNMENRIVIANCGAVNLLVGLLHSPDAKTQEHAVTALLNLSINDNNKIAIASADAVDPLIHVLETGNPEAKENSAATLFSLSVIEENKVKIGRSGAIKPLVDLLGNGTPRGKKDAATALFNLSILHENKARIVQADAVRHLVELMDPAAGMVDKAVAVLANLATIPEGRTAIGQARGIPALVEVVELGSARGKENAAAALLQLCTNSSRFCSIVLQEGAVPPLVALSQSGTPRAREKAQALLSYFRSQRHGNSARR
ncbi:hypothetical protein PR202_ga30927 [Eleusine coracana subsp. coracana]|uniref:RING-type E3 ubiquitin transferase n=1 Tax=Eleusine coracana subsp. coracana TaxID=191504 RepID=A0AAV5DQ49_ELECO|nr:hypothetical protein PR202_ga30927 [Eleusine coracana subsp. coracana]